MTDYSPNPQLTSAQTLALEDRPWYPRWSTPSLGITVHKAGVLTDPDETSVVAVLEDANDQTLGTYNATRDGVGLYHVDLATSDTDVPGIYSLTWVYDLSGVPSQPVTFFEVGQSSPAYEALPNGYPAIVESVMVRLADLFDSPFGGPYLTTKVQANFGRNRIAQLLKIAVDRIGSVAQPHATYDLSGVNGQPIDPVQWGGLIAQGTWVEVLKHLRRSYREQPTLQGANVAILDRSRYASEWDAEIADEKADLASMLSVFKIAQMGLGRPRVLVAGGLYGNLDRYDTIIPGGMPRYWPF